MQPKAYIFHEEKHPDVKNYTQCVTFNVLPEGGDVSNEKIYVQKFN